MARTEARIKTSIWRDESWLALEAMPKLVYITILSQPKLSVCGVIGYTPGAWARLIGIDREDVHKHVLTLQETNFVVLSEATEELWVRTLAKNDGILDKPYMAISMSKEFSAIQSDTIRERFLDALGPRFVASLPDRFPKAFGNECTDPNGPKSLAKPFLDSFAQWFAK